MARSRPRALSDTEAWARDLTALRVTNELLLAGVGGLLEAHASPDAIRRRLRELWELGNPVRATLDIDRVVNAFEDATHECPTCGFEFERVTRVRVRQCDDCRAEQIRRANRAARAKRKVA